MSAPRPDPGARPTRFADCPLRCHDKIRYCDTDRQGHVNNTIFAAFLETGRVELLYAEERSLAATGAEFVIASLALDFLGELRWPGDVQIGSWIEHVGTSSIRMGQRLFQKDRLVAEATTVLVQIDGSTRRARPLSDETRGILESLRL